MSQLSRRLFLGSAGSAAALGLFGRGDTPLESPATASAAGEGQPRRVRAWQVRKEAADYWRDLPPSEHPTNGDEQRYPGRIASFTKTLPHGATGLVDPDAYREYLAAVEAGTTTAWERVPRGGPGKLVSPMAAYSFGLEGPDAHSLVTPPPPGFASEAQAAEMAEVYWMALCRDVPFDRYADDPLTNAAVADLRRFVLFESTTTATLFRGESAGDRAGPYMSQFLLKDVPTGSYTLAQKAKWPLAGIDHVTTMEECLALQRGGAPKTTLTVESTARHVHTGRDLAEWVHRDYSTMGGQDAALLLLSFGAPALSPTNPYTGKKAQAAFANFGGPMVLDVTGRVGRAALVAAWYQKWLVHRRVRPEHYAAHVETTLSGAEPCPVPGSLLDSDALERTLSAHKTAILAQCYPEGCPAHPAYPAGHAVLAGANATVLKAFFNEQFEIPNPVVPSEDGTTLVPYAGKLTVGAELDKMAANIARGRDIAGVHWYSDGIEGIRLGEQVAIGVLRDLKRTVLEDFEAFRFTSYDGKPVVI